MTPEEIAKLVETVNGLSERTVFAERMSHLQEAKIKALESMVIRLMGREREQHTREWLHNLWKAAYDQIISDLEKRDPAYAAQVDVRPVLGDTDQLDWYLIRHEPPSGNQAADHGE